ncbi:hypothetical protein A9Z61_00095 [Moraxella osloensis]|nr:hypothetical protein [Moraxella osloensis]OBX57831.1 hypothetical protein A9Z61_00095 [Moraxella osloensis]BAV11143.1 hypothetical protein MOSL_0570 [Moraxella osloensis]
MSDVAKKSFSHFFNQYFRDELGDLPKSSKHVSFLDTLSSKDYQKAMDVINKLEINHPVDVIVDTTLMCSKKNGLYISANGDVTIKDLWEDTVHKHVDKSNVRFNSDDGEFSIGGEYIKLISNENYPFAKRFVECVKAYKNQGEPAPAPKVDIDTSKSDLDNMDARMRELEASLNK